MDRHLLQLAAMTITALTFAPDSFAQDARGAAAFTSALTSAATSTATTRLLVARSEKLDKLGWLEAETTYRAGEGMTYRIIREGGDKGVRKRVLYKVLENEAKMSAPGMAARFALSPDNYRMSFDPARSAIALTPLRREPALVEGRAFVGAHGEIRRLEGTLAKSPSFWVKSVDVARTYEQVGGHALPVHVESVADVRFAGECEFSMWIDYTAVDGRPVTTATARREPPRGASRSLLVAWQASLND